MKKTLIILLLTLGFAQDKAPVQRDIEIMKLKISAHSLALAINAYMEVLDPADSLYVQKVNFGNRILRDNGYSMLIFKPVEADTTKRGE